MDSRIQYLKLNPNIFKNVWCIKKYNDRKLQVSGYTLCKINLQLFDF